VLLAEVRSLPASTVVGGIIPPSADAQQTSNAAHMPRGDELAADKRLVVAKTAGEKPRPLCPMRLTG
jgi:hypothetical protein